MKSKKLKVEEEKTTQQEGKKEAEKKYKPKSLSIDVFPKNTNEYRHIIDDSKCCKADVEFMLELRRGSNNFTPKHTTLSEPPFYHADLDKYKHKNIYKPEDKKFLSINIGTFRQIFSNRAKYAINNSIYRYEVTLRTEPNKQISKSVINKGTGDKNIQFSKKINPWNSSVLPKERTLFDTLLPPVLPKSKEIFAKYGTQIGRPIIRVEKNGYVNGVKIKGKIFDFHKTLANRFPSEHYPSSTYVNDYGTQNIGAIKHLLEYDNRTMTINWSSYLRGEKKKKFLINDIKKRELRLREKSKEKNYSGKPVS